MTAFTKTIIATMAITAVATYLLTNKYAWGNIDPIVIQMQKENQRIEKDLIGYTKYTDYVSLGKQTLEGQAKLITAKVSKVYLRNQYIERNLRVFSSKAAVALTYAVEYSVGFDLTPNKFDIVSTSEGIEIKVKRPVLVAKPAVSLLSYDMPEESLLIDEKDAILIIQKQLPKLEESNGNNNVAKDPAVMALCEKRLIEFFHGFLAKQPGVKAVPYIKVTYM